MCEKVDPDLPDHSAISIPFACSGFVLMQRSMGFMVEIGA